MNENFIDNIKSNRPDNEINIIIFLCLIVLLTFSMYIFVKDYDRVDIDEVVFVNNKVLTINELYNKNDAIVYKRNNFYDFYVEAYPNDGSRSFIKVNCYAEININFNNFYEKNGPQDEVSNRLQHIIIMETKLLSAKYSPTDILNTKRINFNKDLKQNIEIEMAKFGFILKSFAINIVVSND